MDQMCESENVYIDNQLQMHLSKKYPTQNVQISKDYFYIFASHP